MRTLEKGKAAFDYTRAAIRNSPWISMAVLLHVMLLAIVSVIYIAKEQRKAEAIPTTVRLAQAPAMTPPVADEIPELIDRTSIPAATEEEAGPVNLEEFVERAHAGRPGERTDETDPYKDPGIDNPDPDALLDRLSGPSGGTPVGVGNVGHLGNGPSAYSGRRAGENGKGGGGRGDEGKGGPGGTWTPKTEESVDAALRWLRAHQSPDGRWDADGFGSQCAKNTCSGAGYSSHDVGVTGLALLCFLGAGHTHEQPGPFKNTVRDGLNFLIAQQDEDGCLGPRTGHQFLYDHACAALALVEAFGMTEARPFKEPAQKAVNFTLRAQNPYRAWRYAFPPDGDNDTSVTGWMVMVLKSAKLSGLVVDDGAFASALTWIDESTDPATGRTGYTDRGGAPSRLSALMDEFPADKSEAMTAVGVLTRVFCGRTPDSDKMIGAGAALMASKLPRWDPESGAIDFYYWYYGTLAMFQVGGAGWDKWNSAIKREIVDHQRVNKDEDEYGSWDPIDAWSDVGGRVYSTALNCLCMEVYYRYPRVFGAPVKR